MMKETNHIKSLYLHVPFCKTICGYCDFCHFVVDEKRINLWLDKLEEEIKYKNINENLETIYIGGGTPSVLDIKNLERLFLLLKPYSSRVIEYTIEVNPESCDIPKIKLMKKYGINRVSIGLQSSKSELLKLMNRNHDFKMVENLVLAFKAEGITNISLDVMYGLPNQTLLDLNTTLDDVLSLDVPHISIYCLTIEKNTVFYKRGYKPVDMDLDADMYDFIIEKLSKKYRQYEISNFSYEGFESKHNIAYWKYDDFYGISMGASGKYKNMRYDNTRSLKDYLNNKIIKNELVLSREEMMFENVMMSLRMKDGLDINLFNSRYDVDFYTKYKKVVEDLIKKRLVEASRISFKCSDYGFKVCNLVIEHFW